MKKVFIATACLFTIACHSRNELSKDEARSLIEQNLQQRGPATISISTVDEEAIGKIRDSKLVHSGYIVLIPDAIAYTPRIRFSDNVKPYEVEQVDKYTTRFKSSDIGLKEVKEVKTNDQGNLAAARYVYTWTNPTPFFELQMNKADQTTVAYFTYLDSGWRLNEKPTAEQKALGL